MKYRNTIPKGRGSADAAAGQTDITDKFKDAKFRAYVYEKIGKTAPAPILDSDVSGITNVDVSYNRISDLSGIEYFTALTRLKLGLSVRIRHLWGKFIAVFFNFSAYRF